MVTFRRREVVRFLCHPGRSLEVVGNGDPRQMTASSGNGEDRIRLTDIFPLVIDTTNLEQTEFHVQDP
jgi:hypothetical protein